ncbi:MAG: selenocysteine-specific translation elongation factor [bacterium]
MLVIGTAGHIDHGKSAIVKRLTGTDPDRLPEEKARGLTIDLGFAFRGDGDQSIAFVDVPGHERFVKNMIAGAGGIDVVLLVVAADDGWMPQSEEHFQIVRLLGIERGLIVINKIDLADPDWLELMREDIRDRVAGSFLAEAPVFEVSAVTGQGFEKLSEYLRKLPGQVEVDRDIGAARLYIDRSFVLLGIGGVVTGTLREGALEVGQQVSVWPSLPKGKIRSLHANDQEVSRAAPGQRTAVSFSGLDKEFLQRGGVITSRGSLESLKDNPVLALQIELLPNSLVALEDRRRAICMVGTSEVEGEVRTYRKTQIGPGEHGTVFFLPDEPLLALVGDHFIMRLPTPMVTLGGGRVLDRLPHFPRRRHLDRYGYLEQRRLLTVEDIVVSELVKLVAAPTNEFLANAAVAPKYVRTALQKLTKAGTVGSFGGYLYHQQTLADASARFRDYLGNYLQTNSHLRGLTLSQVYQESPFPDETTRVLLDFAIHEGSIVRLDDKYNLVGRGMTLKGKIKTAHGDIIKELAEVPLAPPKLSALAGRGKDFREAIKYILESGEGYKCGADFIFLIDAWKQILAFVRECLRTSGSMSVGDLKDRLGLSRKWAIPILEETDRLKITRRDGDNRVKGERFEIEDTDP